MAIGFADGLVAPLPTLVAGTSGASLTAPTATLAGGTNDFANALPVATLVANDLPSAKLTAPTLTLSASGVSGTINTAALAAPPPVTSGDFGWSAKLTAPIPTLIANNFPYALLRAPAPQLIGYFAPSMELVAPVPTLEIEYENGAFITATLFAPAITLTASGFAGEVLTFAETAPVPLLEMGTKDLVVEAPVPILTATAVSGTLIIIQATAPAPILLATLNNPAIITADNSASLPQLSAALASGNLAAAVLAARPPILSTQALTGNIATLLAEAATPILAAVGYPAYTMTFAGVAPVPYLDAAISATIAANFRTWVLNTRKGAITSYDSFAFNSYAVFNGVVLAAGAGGVVSLGSQDTDANSPIVAIITTGQESFGSSVHKRVPRIYVSGAMAGDMKFSTITTEGGPRQYLLQWNSMTGTQQRRIPVGKGPRSRFWSFSVENVDGADFAISDVLVYPVKLRRRVM